MARCIYRPFMNANGVICRHAPLEQTGYEAGLVECCVICPEIGASVGPDETLVLGGCAGPNKRGSRVGRPPADAAAERARAGTSMEPFRLEPDSKLRLLATPMRLAIAASRSSISAGILGAGGFGRSKVPNVVFPREGLLDGGNTIEARLEAGMVVDVETGAEVGPARGGGRGRGAHPVRRGRGLTGGRGDEAEWPDGVGDVLRGGEPAELEGDTGEVLGGVEVGWLTGTNGIVGA